jgi:hypothetical protein
LWHTSPPTEAKIRVSLNAVKQSVYSCLPTQLINKRKVSNMENMATKTNRKPSASDTEPAIRYIVDADGKRTEVVLPIVLYERLLEELEELEDIRDFDEAMKDDDFVPWEDVKKQLGV